MPQLLLYVISTFPDCLRAAGVRPQINKPLNVSKRFLSREVLPDFYLRRAYGGNARKQYEKQNGRRFHGASVKRFDYLMLWDWRLTQTPYSFHQSFSPPTAIPEQQ
jgi:hypothetical protein